ncbi:hypothetical protein T08_1771 [Trichinella sp. T8]|nr:hypothetical protein T08_1771 [Trichinella sp. T8]
MCNGKAFCQQVQIFNIEYHRSDSEFTKSNYKRCVMTINYYITKKICTFHVFSKQNTVIGILG